MILSFIDILENKVGNQGENIFFLIANACLGRE
jgi:hypothetical protein